MLSFIGRIDGGSCRALCPRRRPGVAGQTKGAVAACHDGAGDNQKSEYHAGDLWAQSGGDHAEAPRRTRRGVAGATSTATEPRLAGAVLQDVRPIVGKYIAGCRRCRRIPTTGLSRAVRQSMWSTSSKSSTVAQSARPPPRCVLLFGGVDIAPAHPAVLGRMLHTGTPSPRRRPEKLLRPHTLYLGRLVSEKNKTLVCE